jgi:hypothetical protein
MLIRSCSRLADDTKDVLAADCLFSDQEIYDEFWERCCEAAELHDPDNENLRQAVKALARMLRRTQRIPSAHR